MPGRTTRNSLNATGTNGGTAATTSGALSTTTTGATDQPIPAGTVVTASTPTSTTVVTTTTGFVLESKHIKPITKVTAEAIKSLQNHLEGQAPALRDRTAHGCFLGINNMKSSLKKIQKGLKQDDITSQGLNLRTENVDNWQQWRALDVIKLLRHKFDVKVATGGAEPALRKHEFSLTLTNTKEPLREQVLDDINKVQTLINDWNATLPSNAENKVTNLHNALTHMLEHGERTGGSITSYVCGEINKTLPKITFEEESFAENALDACDPLLSAVDLLSELVTFREIKVAAKSNGQQQAATNHIPGNIKKRGHQNNHGNADTKRQRSDDEGTAPPEGECYGCGRRHPGVCRYNHHPDFNHDQKLRWCFSPAGMRWKGKTYRKRESPTELPVDMCIGPNGQPIAYTGNPNKKGKTPEISIHSINTVVETSTNDVLKPCHVHLFSNRGTRLTENTDLLILFDTGALDGNYISSYVVDELLTLNKIHLQSVINHHYEVIRITTINNQRRALTTRGSITLEIEMKNDKLEDILFQIDAHVIPSTFDLIIGLPTIRKFNLLNGHFPSLITAKANETIDLSAASNATVRDNRLRASAEGLIIIDGPGAPSYSEAKDGIDAKQHIHHVNVIKHLVRTKEDLLGIEREPISDLINDEYNISDMMQQMNISSDQERDDEAILDLITFCDDDPQLAQKLRALCRKYITIFRLGLNPDPANVPPMSMTVDIAKWETEGNRGAPRLQGPVRAEEIRKQINDMLKAGVIRRSNAAYYSQVLLTPKSNGEWRFVIDFRRLNYATIKKTWPLPNIKELLRRVGQHRPKRFAKIDFTKGYWQTPLDAASRRFTAFITACGIYEWLRVPMGACDSAGYFQWVITTVVLVGLIYTICEVYLDDILVYGRTDEEFLERLELTFKRFLERNISISPPKCFLGLRSIEYVGHVVDENGLRMSAEKINKVINFRRPVTQKDMKSFLGLANYFRDHIRNYAEITKPLQDMIRKYHKSALLQYSPETELAFENVKLAISNCSTLHFMDAHAPIFLHTDASKYAIGAYLFQVIESKEVPIAFLSHLLNDSQIKWSTYEKEAYAIYYAFTELRYLIRDVKFTLRTDHANLVHIRNSGSEKVIRWKLAIQEYDFVVEHIAGEKNVVADALSRIIEIPFSTMEKAGDIDMREDGSSESANAEVTHTLLTIEQELIMRRDIPVDIHRQIGTVHNSFVGHHGVERTMGMLARKKFKAERLRQHVTEFIRRCPCCQKMSLIKPIIHALPFTTATSQPMQRLNVDTMGPFPIQDGYEFILVIVDSFTRFTELYPMRTTTGKEAALNLLKHIGRYGCPEQLLTDGGHEFVNSALQELTELMGADHLITTPYSKEENGIVERTNREVLRFLQQICLIRYVEDHWVDYLPLVQRILNASVHTSIGTTPASLVFGNQVQLDRNIIIPFDHNTNPNRKLSDYVQDMMRAQAHLLHMAQQVQEEINFTHITSRADRPTEFEPNSYVLVQYPMTRMGRRPPTKLHTPWRGPLRVISNLGPKYTLQNLVTGKSEDMHVSCLKQFVYNPTEVNPYEIAMQDSGDRLLSAVLSHRGNSRKVNTLEFHVRYYSNDPNIVEEKWEKYHDIVNNVVLHQYLREHGMKTLIPKNHRTGNIEGLMDI